MVYSDIIDQEMCREIFHHSGRDGTLTFITTDVVAVARTTNGTRDREPPGAADGIINYQIPMFISTCAVSVIVIKLANDRVLRLSNP